MPSIEYSIESKAKTKRNFLFFKFRIEILTTLHSFHHKMNSSWVEEAHVDSLELEADEVSWWIEGISRDSSLLRFVNYLRSMTHCYLYRRFSINSMLF